MPYSSTMLYDANAAPQCWRVKPVATMRPLVTPKYNSGPRATTSVKSQRSIGQCPSPLGAQPVDSGSDASTWSWMGLMGMPKKLFHARWVHALPVNSKA
jgi:hypothetical protein